MPRHRETLRSLGMISDSVLGRRPARIERLTNELVANLTPMKREYSVHDHDEYRIAVRVRDNGTKSLTFTPSRLLVGGKTKRIVLGVHPITSVEEARVTARLIVEAFKSSATSIDAFVGLSRSESVKSLVPPYLGALRGSPEWRRKVELAFERRIIPSLGDRSLDDLKPSDVRLALQKRSRSPHTHRQDFYCLSSLLSFAVDTQRLERNPLTGSLAPPRPARKGKSPLTLTKVARLFTEAEHLPPVWSAFFKFLILSGMAVDEILAIQGGQVDVNASMLTRDRNRYPGHPLTKAEVDALSPVLDTDTYLFGDRSNEMPKRFCRKAFLGLREASNVSTATVRDISKFVQREIRDAGCPERWITQLIAAVSEQDDGVVL